MIMLRIAERISASPEDYHFKSSVKGDGDYKVGVRSPLINILILAVSLVLSFVLWVYVAGLNKIIDTFTFDGIPVDIVNVNSGLFPYSGNGTTVNVTVRGVRREIKELEASSIIARADVSEYSTAGEYTVDINVRIDDPGSLVVVDQSVSSVRVFLDNRSSTTVPVTSTLGNTNADSGVEVGMSDITYDVPEIVVSGPGSALNKIASAQLRLDLGYVTGSRRYTGEVKLVDAEGKQLKDDDLTYVSLSTKLVTAYVPVYFKKTVPLAVSYKYGYFNDKTVKVEIDPSAVDVKGENDVLSKLQQIDLTPLDETKVLSDSVTRKIEMPKDVTNVSGVDEAKISIKYLSTAVKEVVSEIELNNPQGLDVELLSETLNVTLRGEEQYINYVNPSDVKAVVDLSTYSSATGEFSVPVVITVKNTYSEHVYAIGEYTASVRVG